MKSGVWKKLLGGCGVLISLASVTMVSAAIGDLISGGGDTTPGILVGLIIFFTGTAVASGYFAKKQLQGAGPSREDTAHSHETMILQLAMKHGGQLNIAQIAALTPMSVDEAKTAMTQLSQQGVAEVEFNHEGEMFYVFGGLQNFREDAGSARLNQLSQDPSRSGHVESTPSKEREL